MDYDAIAAIFLVPNGSEGPAPVLAATPARRLRDAVEPIATIGWWSREAADACTALGHGFFDGYVWGRAASLGADVATPVVVSAFGVFHPTLLGQVLGPARSVSSREAILTSRAEGAAAGLRAAIVGSKVDSATTGALADQLLDALSLLDGSARPLFSALRALTIPDDPFGRLWRAAELVREHRGDGHLAACVAAGLDMAEMNVLTEIWLGYGVGEYSATRGFDSDAQQAAINGLTSRGWMSEGALTAAGNSARESIERATDSSQEQLVRALGNGLDELVSQLDVVGAAVLSAQAAPADPRKRAAG
jgi:hypothetical protein